MERELAMSIKTVDHGFLLESGGEAWVEHFEAESVLAGEDLATIAQRAMLLGIKNGVPAWTTIMLLSRRGSQPDASEEIRVPLGGVTIAVRAGIVRRPVKSCRWRSPG
ncbi:MAG: hypothetical protein R2729_29580 [Bryobacteraceae bacterium]